MPISPKLGSGGLGIRDLYALDLPHLEVPPDTFAGISGHFVACLALDGTTSTDQEIHRAATALIRAGCSYLCCWGPDCGRVHDLADLADLDLHPEGPWLITTWHKDEPLDEALWFALHTAWPDPAFEDTTNTVVGISIGNAGWSEAVRDAFSDPDGFHRRLLGL